MSEFEVYSLVHGLIVLACFVSIVTAVLLGVRWARKAPEREVRLRRAWCVFVVAFQVFVTIWWLLPGNLDLKTSLPLHLCDLVVWLVPFALLGQMRLTQSLLYFCGLALSSIAFASPILEAGPTRLEFWLFWIGHTQIVGSALYLLVVRGFRPESHDFEAALIATLVYSALIVPLNLALEANYGMLGRASGAASQFGPWPERIFVLLALETLMYVLFWVPWALARLRPAPLPIR